MLEHLERGLDEGGLSFSEGIVHTMVTACSLCATERPWKEFAPVARSSAA